MWVETVDGKLLNLDQTVSIEVREVLPAGAAERSQILVVHTDNDDVCLTRGKDFRRVGARGHQGRDRGDSNSELTHGCGLVYALAEGSVMKKPSMKPVAILKLRHSLRLTQKELARKLGVTEWTVCRWERGTHPVNLKNLRKLEKLVPLALA